MLTTWEFDKAREIEQSKSWRAVLGNLSLDCIIQYELSSNIVKNANAQEREQEERSRMCEELLRAAQKEQAEFENEFSIPNVDNTGLLDTDDIERIGEFTVASVKNQDDLPFQGPEK